MTPVKVCREHKARQKELIRRLEASTRQAQDTNKAAAEAVGEARKQQQCVVLLSKQLADSQLALRWGMPQHACTLLARMPLTP